MNPPSPDASGACPINLDRGGVRRRAVGGVLAGFVGAGLATYAVATDRGLAWRLPAAALLAFAALAWLQARAKT
jgi:hypothetical protein